MTQKRVVSGAMIAAILALAAIVSARPAQAATSNVSIIDFSFSPASVTVAVGDTVTWTNNGAAPHTTTSDATGWNSGTLQPGGTFSRVFSAAGTFAYHCNIHPSMTGTVVVQAASTATATATATATQTATATATATQTASATATATQTATSTVTQTATASATASATPRPPTTGSGVSGGGSSSPMLPLALAGAAIAMGSAGAYGLARRRSR